MPPRTLSSSAKRYPITNVPNRNLVRKHKTDLLASTGRGLRLHHHLFRDFREALDVGVANPTPDLDTMSARYGVGLAMSP